MTVRQKIDSRKKWDAGMGALRFDRGQLQHWFDIASLSLSPNSYVLDIGCGLGVDLCSFSCEKVGLDISVRNLKQAKKLDPAAHFLLGDAENLPFKGGVFDVVMLIETIHNIPSYERALRQISFILKTWGWLLIEDESSEGFLIIYPFVKLARCIAHLRGHFDEGLGMPLARGLQTLLQLGFSIKNIETKGTGLKAFWFSALTGHRFHPSIRYGRPCNLVDTFILAIDTFLRKTLPPRLLVWYKLVALKCPPGFKPTIAPIRRNEF